jgi:DNA-binding CsgD family transcriptional regulator
MGSGHFIQILALDDNPLNRHVLEGICANGPLTSICHSNSDSFPVGREIDLILINLNHRSMCFRYLIGRAEKYFPGIPVLGYLNTFNSVELEEYRIRTSSPLILLTYQELILQLREYMQLIQHEEALPVNFSTKGQDGKISNLEMFIRLSPKEKDIFCLIGKGLGSSEISEIVCCSIRTVESHVRNLGNKLNLSGQFELRRFAIRMSVNNQCKVLSEGNNHHCSYIQDSIGKCPYLKAQ